ncbi:Protein TOXD [Lachnellula suecica]|uniref:Protein TOXD n=1 Tax=Lachnellula suecica TaxID=602035 RepID=A0A8T9CHX1_9HELO|nr:Protein TOXD [Lachnellula suecica]
MSTPKEMQAIVHSNPGDESVKSIALPHLRPTYLLIKVNAVALNPTDWKHVTYLKGASPYSTVGCDYAGTVVSIGAEVTKPFKIGDKVYGVAHGSNSNESTDGVFAEYAMVAGDLAMHVPTSSSTALSLEDLSTIGLGSITNGQGLFQPGKGLGLAFPDTGKGDGEWLLIYGGSTATGTLGIQFAKLAGYKVITTCSPKNNDLVRSLGADEVFDYKDPECAAKIRKLTGDKLKYAWDTVGDGSEVICDEALSSDSSICHYASVSITTKVPRKDVKSSLVLMYTMFGKSFSKATTEFPASKEDYEFGKTWMALTEKLVAEGKLKPHPKRVGSGGLEGALKGMEEMKAGKISGEKLVYRI